MQYPSTSEGRRHIMLIDSLVKESACETLHPDNIVAKLFTRKCLYSDKERDYIHALLGDCFNKNDTAKYNAIVDWC